MSYAYIIAFYDNDKDIINRVGIFSEAHPTIIGPISTHVLLKIKSRNYQEASEIAAQRLHEIVQNSVVDYEYLIKDNKFTQEGKYCYYIVAAIDKKSLDIKDVFVCEFLPPTNDNYRFITLYVAKSDDKKTVQYIANKRLHEIVSSINLKYECQLI